MNFLILSKFLSKFKETMCELWIEKRIVSHQELMKALLIELGLLICIMEMS